MSTPADPASTPSGPSAKIPKFLDDAATVRAGEELDRERLAAYLRSQLGAADAAADTLTVKQFPGGYSNLTYLLRWGDRELVLRRPPFGSKVKSAHDMGREYRILDKLHPVYPRVPRPLAFCEDESVLGAKFYLMERVRGVILRRTLPPDLDMPPERMAALCATFCDHLVELHALDYRKIGLEGLGHPEGYVERQVSGWSKRMHDALAPEDPSRVPLEQVSAWLREHIPPSPPATIVHNDYKFDNLVLDPADLQTVRGVLDWEMATLGDPLMDLGTALSYWVEATDSPEMQFIRFGPTTTPGSYTRRQIAEGYARRSGRDLSHILFYYCFGLFKNAVVAQQIYFRFKQGLTKDPRFASLGEGARIIAEQGASYLGRSEL